MRSGQTEIRYLYRYAFHAGIRSRSYFAGLEGEDYEWKLFYTAWLAGKRFRQALAKVTKKEDSAMEARHAVALQIRWRRMLNVGILKNKVADAHEAVVSELTNLGMTPKKAIELTDSLLVGERQVVKCMRAAPSN